MSPLATPAAVALAFLVGLCAGSFLNVVIHRLPRMLERGWRENIAEYLDGEAALPDAARAFRDWSERSGTSAPLRDADTRAPVYNLAVPRSACPACGHRIGALENVPLVSWLALRARCRGCGAAISARYPLVELAGGVLAALAIYRFGVTLAGVAACGLLWALVALTLIDFDHKLLPDDITLPLMWAGVLLHVVLAAAGTVAPFGVRVDLADSVIGAMAGYLALWSVYWLFRLLRGKEGMGYGDFKLLAALGAWLGWQLLVPVILLSSVVGAIIGILLIVVRGRDHNVPLAFGPYLAIAGGVALFFGPALVALQQGLLR
jgi:leader peptidase (prepilin peptidase)/N-methyltransferase